MKVVVCNEVGELISIEGNMLDAVALSGKSVLPFSYDIEIFNEKNGKGRYLKYQNVLESEIKFLGGGAND